ncbi:hypothetical protein DFJ73DRAFT_767414 [Zopfochytrium polystomum]|nr:hypothetical protein DFJ73DRAFT_767414 [Zopfochytrium polystomum]
MHRRIMPMVGKAMNMMPIRILLIERRWLELMEDGNVHESSCYRGGLVTGNSGERRHEIEHQKRRRPRRDASGRSGWVVLQGLQRDVGTMAQLERKLAELRCNLTCCWLKNWMAGNVDVMRGSNAMLLHNVARFRLRQLGGRGRTPGGHRQFRCQCRQTPPTGKTKQKSKKLESKTKKNWEDTGKRMGTNNRQKSGRALRLERLEQFPENKKEQPADRATEGLVRQQPSDKRSCFPPSVSRPVHHQLRAG